jgi:hypothetical protein
VNVTMVMSNQIRIQIEIIVTTIGNTSPPFFIHFFLCKIVIKTLLIHKEIAAIVQEQDLVHVTESTDTEVVVESIYHSINSMHLHHN